MRHHIIFLALIGLLSTIGCGKKAIEQEPTPVEDLNLAPTLAMQFVRAPLNAGGGFSDIVFTADGRAAALSVNKEIYFSNNDGASWQLVRKYSTLNNDTTIQSIALHPTQDIVFLGASFLHNFDSHLRHLIIKKDAGKWQDHIIVSPKYIDQTSNPQYIPAGYKYNHSYWFKNYVINSFSNVAGNDGFVSIQLDPEKTDGPSPQNVMLPVSKNSYVASCVIPIFDGFNKLFNCAGSEILPSKVKANTRISMWQDFSWMTFNSSDNNGRPACCVPDYMAASPNLSADRFNKLMLYTGLGKLYHTRIMPAANHQQEIILPKDVLGYGDYLCVGIDRQRYVWIGTATIGMYKSTTPLP